MNFLMTLRIAFRALRRNKMRSGLTMLGIIIGVGAVIAMIAIGSGAKARIQEQIASMGSNLLIVLPERDQRRNPLGLGIGSHPHLDDAKAIATSVRREIRGPRPEGVAQVVYGNQNWSTITYGTTPEALAHPGLAGGDGQTLTEPKWTGRLRSACLGQTVAENLFGDDGSGRPDRPRSRRFPSRWSGCLPTKGRPPGVRTRTISSMSP